MDLSGCAGDSSFGPAVHGCRDDFDFTLEFERIFFSIIPSSAFVALSLARCVWLVRRPVLVSSPALRSVKTVSYSPALRNERYCRCEFALR